MKSCSHQYHYRNNKWLTLTEEKIRWVFCGNKGIILLFQHSNKYQRTNGPVNAHLISWPSKAQNIQNLEKYMVKK